MEKIKLGAGPDSLHVGRLLLRPAKLVPSGFFLLDPLMSPSKQGDKDVLYARPGRERGYLANGLVALSVYEKPCGLAVITDRTMWREDWACVEITYASAKFAKAVQVPHVDAGQLEKYYRWVRDNLDEGVLTFEEWLAKQS